MECEQDETEIENVHNASSNGNAARRPMNAFLIFCKRHRAQVREKYPHLENRQVTKILGEWWADLPQPQKSPHIELAKEYKDFFLKANPDFKWYKFPAHPVRPPPAKPSNQKVPRPIPTKIDGSITFGKLADEAQMGSLSFLLTSTENQTSGTEISPDYPFNDSFNSKINFDLFPRNDPNHATNHINSPQINYNDHKPFIEDIHRSNNLQNRTSGLFRSTIDNQMDLYHSEWIDRFDSGKENEAGVPESFLSPVTHFNVEPQPPRPPKKRYLQNNVTPEPTIQKVPNNSKWVDTRCIDTPITVAHEFCPKRDRAVGAIFNETGIIKSENNDAVAFEERGYAVAENYKGTNSCSVSENYGDMVDYKSREKSCKIREENYKSRLASESNNLTETQCDRICDSKVKDRLIDKKDHADNLQIINNNNISNNNVKLEKDSGVEGDDTKRQVERNGEIDKMEKQAEKMMRKSDIKAVIAAKMKNKVCKKEIDKEVDDKVELIKNGKILRPRKRKFFNDSMKKIRDTFERESSTDSYDAVDSPDSRILSRGESKNFKSVDSKISMSQEGNSTSQKDSKFSLSQRDSRISRVSVTHGKSGSREEVLDTSNDLILRRSNRRKDQHSNDNSPTSSGRRKFAKENSFNAYKPKDSGRNLNFDPKFASDNQERESRRVTQDDSWINRGDSGVKRESDRAMPRACKGKRYKEMICKVISNKNRISKVQSDDDENRDLRSAKKMNNFSRSTFNLSKNYENELKKSENCDFDRISKNYDFDRISKNCDFNGTTKSYVNNSSKNYGKESSKSYDFKENMKNFDKINMKTCGTANENYDFKESSKNNDFKESSKNNDFKENSKSCEGSDSTDDSWLEENYDLKIEGKKSSNKIVQKSANGHPLKKFASSHKKIKETQKGDKRAKITSDKERTEKTNGADNRQTQKSDNKQKSEDRQTQKNNKERNNNKLDDHSSKSNGFNLEGRIEALPSLNLEEFTTRKKDKKRTVNGITVNGEEVNGSKTVNLKPVNLSSVENKAGKAREKSKQESKNGNSNQSKMQRNIEISRKVAEERLVKRVAQERLFKKVVDNSEVSEQIDSSLEHRPTLSEANLLCDAPYVPQSELPCVMSINRTNIPNSQETPYLGLKMVAPSSQEAPYLGLKIPRVPLVETSLPLGDGALSRDSMGSQPVESEYYYPTSSSMEVGQGQYPQTVGGQAQCSQMVENEPSYISLTNVTNPNEVPPVYHLKVPVVNPSILSHHSGSSLTPLDDPYSQDHLPLDSSYFHSTDTSPHPIHNNQKYLDPRYSNQEAHFSNQESHYSNQDSRYSNQDHYYSNQETHFSNQDYSYKPVYHPYSQYPPENLGSEVSGDFYEDSEPLDLSSVCPESDRTPLVGSQKRKARKETITRRNPCCNNVNCKDMGVYEEQSLLSTIRLQALADVAVNQPALEVNPQ